MTRSPFPVITREREQIGYGDLTFQGLPFYTGAVTFETEISVGEQPCAEYSLHIPEFEGCLIEAELDGVPKGILAFAPHRLLLGELSGGKHSLKLRLIGSRFNGFGTIHNANEQYTWYGPDSYRTKGKDWSDDYLLRPFGIMKAPEIERVEW